MSYAVKIQKARGRTLIKQIVDVLNVDRNVEHPLDMLRGGKRFSGVIDAKSLSNKPMTRRRPYMQPEFGRMARG